MITPVEIRSKALRHYHTMLQAWIRDEPFAPLRFPVGSLPSDFVALREQVQSLRKASKEALGYGFTLVSRLQQTRKFGSQTLPLAILFSDRDNFLRFIDKMEEAENYIADMGLIRAQLPQLASWGENHPSVVIAHHGDWPGLLEVGAYFLEHPKPGVYLRELPVTVHTKFIEMRRGIVREILEAILPQDSYLPQASRFEERFGLRQDEPFARLRFLDNQWERQYGLLITDLQLPLSTIATLNFQGQRCLIVENLMTFLTLPPLTDAFAIWGEGFKVVQLAHVTWLAECPIYYWGDLDAQGFQILAQLRAALPQVVSVMMDAMTLQAFPDFCVVGTPSSVQSLPYLTPDEATLFQHLATTCCRLEQERIHHAYAIQRWHEVLGSTKK